MRKFLFTLVATLSLFGALCLGAAAQSNDMLKVGIKYGSDALFSANLQNYSGSGYTFGYYDSQRNFVPLAQTEETKLSMTADGTIYVSGGTYYAGVPTYSYDTIGGYHAQFTEAFESFEQAQFVAKQFRSAYVAYIDGAFYVRSSHYTTKEAAQEQVQKLASCTYTTLEGETKDVESTAVSPSKTAVVVTSTATTNILFSFDCGGLRNLAIEPIADGGEKPATWFKGYRYYGGFEYQRITGGNLSVINVVDIEDYVKCVIPWEMSNDWPLEALKAQSVCARTYASRQTKHSAKGFDVCTTTDCQVYQGMSACTEHSDAAVDETKGVLVYYNGKLADTVYYSSNGGASESAKNVWGSEIGYLQGKEDPYEGDISSFEWSVTFTAQELTNILKTKGYSLGTVANVYVSERTPTDNVYAITFVDTAGQTKTLTGEKVRTVFNGVYSGRSVSSMRFWIGGTENTTLYVNDKKSLLSTLQGIFTISGSGKTAKYSGTASSTWVQTADDCAPLQSSTSTGSSGSFTITGNGWGHNVGMSQWGAKAMAERGYDYEEILTFYYTDITLSD